MTLESGSLPSIQSSLDAGIAVVPDSFGDWNLPLDPVPAGAPVEAISGEIVEPGAGMPQTIRGTDHDGLPAVPADGQAAGVITVEGGSGAVLAAPNAGLADTILGGLRDAAAGVAAQMSQTALGKEFEDMVGAARNAAGAISASMIIPTDPFYPQLWHLDQNVGGLFDLNVEGVWDNDGLEYTGFGIRIVVVDDGFDYTHPDIAPNYDTFLDFDWDANNNGDNGNHDFDPFGLAGNAHGTAVTGIIAANNDNFGVVGVAFDSSIVGYRTHGFITDGWLRDIRDSIHHAAVTTLGAVINISQGIANDANSEFGVGYAAARFDEIETSINTAVDSGRGGLGTTIVKSAGNSRSDNYDVNADDWTNDTRQVVVAAVNQNGFVSSYSSYGAAVLISAFGTPGDVITTDRVGAAGYNNTDFTFFNGTSAAAPMVSGIVALMYDANAGLGWRDVQHILANTGRHVGSNVGAGVAGSERYPWFFNQADTWNGGGLHFSNDYGYGLIDATAAVRLAETWLLGGHVAQVSNNEFTNFMDMLDVATVIPDGNLAGLTFTGNATFADEVERVTVTLTFSTTFTGDMEIYVTSPLGTVSELIDDTGGSTDFNGTWTFETQAFHGERANGIWSVRIVDDAGADVLTVSDIDVTTFGRFSSNDRYVYTNEYSDYDGIFGHVTSVNDTNGGTDTVNAAAVTSSSIIRLDGVAGLIDGVLTAFFNIENAIAGDGNDTLIGNGFANFLYGGRGNDTLDGAGGGDTMQGMAGNDIYVVDNVGDFVSESVFGSSGTDTVRSSTINVDLSNGAQYSGALERIELFGAGNLNATGNVFSNFILGNSGNNVIDGGAGGDTMRGLTGNDTYVIDNALDTVDEATGGGGNDTVRSSTINVNLSNAAFFFGDLEIIRLDGALNLNATGNGLNNAIVGNSGNNIIDGRGGNDAMRGLAGHDTYYVDTNGDVVDENFAGSGGNDTVRTSTVSIDLENAVRFLGEVEDIVLEGATALNAFGNSLSNDIFGNSGANFLDGRGGNDTMYGRGGNDIYRINTGGDIVDETAAGSGGTDTVRSATINVDLSNATRFFGQIEQVVLEGALNLSATGNGQANLLIGNTGANTLDGGAGGDTMRGLAGNDTYRVDSINDTVDEAFAGSGGTDTVRSSTIDVDLTNAARYLGNIEQIVLDGAANLRATGNDLANVILGNDGNNLIRGGLGADTLRGNGGNDRFRFDTALGGGNIDTIDQYVIAEDQIELENAVFTGLSVGVLGAARFFVGAAATTSDHRIIYNSATGALLFDADGLGGAAHVRFGTLAAGLAMTASEFSVI